MALLINDTFECRGISPSIHTAVPQATFNQASAILVRVAPKQPQHFMRAKYFLGLLANRFGLTVLICFPFHSQMKTFPYHTAREVLWVWPTGADIQMALNSSSRYSPLLGWTRNMLLSGKERTTLHKRTVRL